MSKTSSGRFGEDLAASYLKKQGYRIVERNFQTRSGEIDIVAIVDETLVFVEVKTRWSASFGLPEEAVTPVKLAAIKRAAGYFRLQRSNLPEAERIDVVALELDQEGKISRIEVFKNVSSF